MGNGEGLTQARVVKACRKDFLPAQCALSELMRYLRKAFAYVGEVCSPGFQTLGFSFVAEPGSKPSRVDAHRPSA